MAEPLIEARGLVAGYAGRRGLAARRSASAPVLHSIDVAVGRGEVVGIVGESGSGKTTLGRALLRLIAPLAGAIRFDGVDITGFDEAALRPLRRRMQMIFQDPMLSLNPRRRIGRALTDPLLLHRRAANRRVAERIVTALLERVGLPTAVLQCYPHELSGGQRQRVGIARSIVLEPEFVLADEIVSGLDASTQAQVLKLLGELKRSMSLSIAFISHDLSVVRAVCDRVYVMAQGVIVEEGASDALFQAPRHAYTRALIDAIPLPVPDPNWLSQA
ncbi:MAG: ABC transporter ATP-binding protein [Methylobacteriaceae bacterium]|nr:ABC transporter ATP-binding protein [Methylobacteriaceae bacterium]